jgi:hypothetical protein
MLDRLTWCECPGWPPFPRDSEGLCDARKLFRADGSMWLMVFARGRMLGAPTLFDTEFLRTRPEGLGGRPVVLSRRALRGLDDVAPAACSFC